nr:biotin/lipoyl-containing protein [Corynebacterium pseudotuberculosis]
MPELGESVTEGTITQWLKSVGDTVDVDEPLLEVSTDKVDTEVPSPVAGVCWRFASTRRHRKKLNTEVNCRGKIYREFPLNITSVWVRRYAH